MDEVYQAPIESKLEAESEHILEGDAEDRDRWSLEIPFVKNIKW